MVNEKALANSVATVVGVGYVICRLIAGIAPQFLFTIGQSWFHTINLGSIPAESSMSFGMFILGLVSSMVVAWVAVYATVHLYRRWER